jgi:uncharacterized membrane protein YagU involved in acid resistance
MKSPIYGVVAGALAVALLGATDDVMYFRLTAHLNLVQVLQYVASGALGDAAFSGGLGTAFAGLAFHLSIAFAVVYAFAVLYTRSRTVRIHAPAAGHAYGAAVWCFMNLVILPSSAVAPAVLTPVAVIHGVIGHAFFVGLPAALSIRRYFGDESALGSRVVWYRDAFDEGVA